MPNPPPMAAATSSASSMANGAITSKKPAPASTASSQALRRAPSLSEIAASIQSTNPEKWERIRKKSIAAADSAALAQSAAASAPMAQSKSLDPASLNAGGALPTTVLQSASMLKTGSMSSNGSSPGLSAAETTTAGTSLDAPRLRLTARLAVAAPAPLLSRSQSTNAIVQSDEQGNGLVTSPDNGGALPGSSLPALSTLQTTLARRSSVSAATSQSLPSHGLPSLEAIEKRFAQKKDKEKEKDPVSSTASSTDAKTNDSLPNASISASAVSSQAPANGAKAEAATASDASKENIDPNTGIDASRRASVSRLEPISVAMSKASSGSSSGASSASPTTPTDITMPLSEKGAMNDDHPLEHKWTLYYDSRNTTRAAAAASKPATPTSVGHPNGTSTGKQQYEAGLSTLASVTTVESFCRLYNWLKKPGKMGMNENLHLFKEDILPMWEDDRNKQGGKWTVCLDNKIMNVREMVDKLWMYLCFAMIGEDFEEKNDLICGAVISTRPRMFRFQIWIKEKDDIESVNAIGKNLVRILELENPTTGVRPPGISLDFSYHSKATPPVQKFLHIPLTPVPAPSSAFQALPGQVNGQPSRGLTPSGSTASISSLARPPGLGMVGNTFGGIGLSRAVSMNAIASKLASGNMPDQSAGNSGTISWRERLGQAGRKSTLAAT